MSPVIIDYFFPCFSRFRYNSASNTMCFLNSSISAINPALMHLVFVMKSTVISFYVHLLNFARGWISAKLSFYMEWAAFSLANTLEYDVRMNFISIGTSKVVRIHIFLNIPRLLFFRYCGVKYIKFLKSPLPHSLFNYTNSSKCKGT